MFAGGGCDTLITTLADASTPTLLVTSKVYVVVVVGFTVIDCPDVIFCPSTVVFPLMVFVVALVNTGVIVVELPLTILALVVVIEAVGAGTAAFSNAAMRVSKSNNFVCNAELNFSNVIVPSTKLAFVIVPVAISVPVIVPFII